MPDPGVTGLPSGILGLAAVVGGALVVMLLGWLVSRSERKALNAHSAQQARSRVAPRRPSVQAQPKPGPKAPAQSPATDPAAEAEALLGAVTADYLRRKRLMVESNKLIAWMSEFNVTSLAALAHSHSTGIQSTACSACTYEALGLSLLSLPDLDPGLIEDPWSELWFDNEEHFDAFADGLSEEELELKAQGVAWRERVLDRVSAHRYFAKEKFRRSQIEYLRTQEAHGPMPKHDHDSRRSFDDGHSYVGCPACRYMLYRRPIDPTG